MDTARHSNVEAIWETAMDDLWNTAIPPCTSWIY